jgi:hypothetical protein
VLLTLAMGRFHVDEFSKSSIGRILVWLDAHLKEQVRQADRKR